MNDENKLIIYQVFTRLFGNNNNHCINNGSITENGCGKMADFTAKALGEIKKLGATHIWYTGIIEHATQTDYRRHNIQPDHPAIVKGKAGSPYAIKDYYDVDPDLAKDVPERMREFENLVQRTHRSGLKVIIDFVPNHVARQYHSDAQPDGTSQLGSNDDTNYAFSPYNNFYYIPKSELHGQFDMKGVTLIMNPLVNSYKRLVPGYEAPCYIAWSATNRSPLIRIPASRGEETRVELRSPGPAANPYLALAVCLAAGIDGIRNKIEPPEEVPENVYELKEEEKASRGIESLPADLHAAICELQKDAFIKEVLGEHISSKLIEAKEAEWMQYRTQVTGWEIEEYLYKI